ncbi:helix-turn-helix domain-containing protein [Tolypothrix sp. VBCCA 56010]|uniref:helix-turn-helix domain-containing protein n=1 Tax=Tolypothrix sp. VBCCA 56010 TaxID=3137731 RepID=UPI003D7C8759
MGTSGSNTEVREIILPIDSTFVGAAHTGSITTIAQIHKAFEERIGTSVDSSTIYRLLSRHGWRKLTPRPHHPKADKHEQEAFKKTFLIWSNKSCKAENQTILVPYFVGSRKRKIWAYRSSNASLESPRSTQECWSTNIGLTQASQYKVNWHIYLNLRLMLVSIDF